MMIKFLIILKPFYNLCELEDLHNVVTQKWFYFYTVFTLLCIVIIH